MKNLRKLVPKEELDALFKEIYKEESSEGKKETISENIDKRYYILAYKFQKILKKTFVSNIPVLFKIKNFSIKNVEFPDNYKDIVFLGYDLEGKFRFFLGVEQKLEEIVKDILNLNGILTEKNEQNIIESFLDQSITQILENINLKKKKLLTSYLSFYDDDISAISFNCVVNNKEIKMFLFFEEDLLDLMDISPIMFSPLTSIGKKNMKLLRKYIPIKIVLETSPIYISLMDLKEGNDIFINKITIKKRKFL